MFFTREETIQYRIPEDGKPVSANSIAAGVVKKIMDNYIHSLHWKTFLILTAGLFMKAAFMIALFVLYLYKGHTSGAFCVAAVMFAYNAAQDGLVSRNYTLLSAEAGLATFFAGYYIWMGGHAWHLIIIISALFLFELVCQHGMSFFRDANALTSAKEKLTEEDIANADSSMICVQTTDGREYSFEWNVEEIRNA